jgi:hypothetical protein
MTDQNAEQPDRELARERINTLRVVGGMLLILALLLYFFHLAEAAMGQSTIGVLAGFSGAIGVALLWVGRLRLRKLQ